MNPRQHSVRSPIFRCLLATAIIGGAALLASPVTSATLTDTPTVTPTATPTEKPPGSLVLELRKPDLPRNCTTCGAGRGGVNIALLETTEIVAARKWVETTTETFALPQKRYQIIVYYAYTQCKPDPQAPLHYVQQVVYENVWSNQTTTVSFSLEPPMPSCGPVEPPEPSTFLLTGSGLSIAVAGYYLNRWRQRFRK